MINKFRNPGHQTRFADCERASVAPLFGLMVVVVFGIVAVAIEYARLQDVTTKLQAAADAAAITATTTALQYITENGAQGEAAIAGAKRVGEEAARKFFESGAKKLQKYTNGASVEVTMSGGQVLSTVTFKGEMQTDAGRVLNVDNMVIGGTSTAVGDMPPFVELHLLIDTSGSMALGASDADQRALVARIGCAFACHDGAPVGGYADSYALAAAEGILLRYGAVQNGISALLDEIEKQASATHFVNVALYSFDNALTIDTPPTSDMSTVRASMPKTPALSGEIDGATHFNEIIGDVVSRIGAGGDGKSPGNPLKMLIIATDGVQDPGRHVFSTPDPAGQKKIDAFDMDFCQTLKDADVKVGIIHTPYLGTPGVEAYDITLGQPSNRGGPGKRIDDIEPALKGCAGDKYIQASETAEIQTAFTAIFKSLRDIYITH